MSYPLLFSTSVLAEPTWLCAETQDATAAGHCRLVLPRKRIEPFAFTSNREVNGSVIAASARSGRTVRPVTTASASTTIRQAAR